MMDRRRALMRAQVAQATTATHKWNFTESMTDEIGNVTATINTGVTQSSAGLSFTAANAYCSLGNLYALNKTYEIDVTEIGTATTANHRRLFMTAGSSDTGSGGRGFIYNKSGYWSFYNGSSWVKLQNNTLTNAGMFDGKTVNIFVDNDGYWHLKTRPMGQTGPWTEVGTSASPVGLGSINARKLYFGGSSTDGLCQATITGFRIYDGEV